MNKLSQDNLEVLNYLYPQDISSLSSSSKTIETICKNIFKNTIEWLDKQCIKYELLVTREIKDEAEEWFQNGKRHRDNDLPAVIKSDGKKEWWQNGELHRDNDLPAVIRSDGGQFWYKNGKRQRQ